MLKRPHTPDADTDSSVRSTKGALLSPRPLRGAGATLRRAPRFAACACLAAGGALFGAAGGCADANYLATLISGEAGVLLHSVPIEDALQSNDLTAEQLRKLELIVDARDFARDRLGLRVNNSFSRFHDTAGEPVAYNLSAARQDSLAPKRWTFPLVGPIDYIGFFSRADADRAVQRLRDDGYDTVLYAVDAFSTLGLLPDPVHSPLLNREDINLVDTVIHELAHNTIYALGQSDFNESTATWVGHTGAALFYAERGATSEDVAELLRRQDEDRRLFDDWMAELTADLREYYAQDRPSEEKIAGRGTVYAAARARFVSDVQPQLHEPQRYASWGNLEPNNALVLLYRRYHLDLDVFDQVYEQTGRDFAAMLETLDAAAASGDPFATLRQSSAAP